MVRSIILHSECLFLDTLTTKAAWNINRLYTKSIERISKKLCIMPGRMYAFFPSKTHAMDYWFLEQAFLGAYLFCRNSSLPKHITSFTEERQHGIRDIGRYDLGL